MGRAGGHNIRRSIGENGTNLNENLKNLNFCRLLTSMKRFFGSRASLTSAIPKGCFDQVTLSPCELQDRPSPRKVAVAIDNNPWRTISMYNEK